MNNTCVEILESLLSKKKTQSLRKAWKQCDECDAENLSNCRYCKGTDMLEKPAKYKVGEKVQMVWDKDNESRWFASCNNCSLGILPLTNYINIPLEGNRIEGVCPVCIKEGFYGFNKNLGTVEITEVFKVRMFKNRLETPFMQNTEQIAKQDGFKSVEDMFTYFDKTYNLSVPREFWVYRMRWLE